MAELTEREKTAKEMMQMVNGKIQDLKQQKAQTHTNRVRRLIFDEALHELDVSPEEHMEETLNTLFHLPKADAISNYDRELDKEIQYFNRLKNLLMDDYPFLNGEER